MMFERTWAATTCLALSAATFGAIDNLGADFSDVNNPNGVWRLEKNTDQQLFSIVQPDYYSNQTYQVAWADEPYPAQMHVPFWCRVTTLDMPFGPYDVALGDILMHGSVFSRTGATTTSAVWVSPVNGTADIAGSTWMIARRGRVMDWEIWRNNVKQTSGRLYEDGTNSRVNPFLFQNGSGGLFALTQPVAVGDRLELRFQSLDELPDMAGVNFEVASMAGVSTDVLAPVSEQVMLGTSSGGGNLASWANDDEDVRRVCKFIVPSATSPYLRVNLNFASTKLSPSRVILGVQARSTVVGAFKLRLSLQRKTDSAYIQVLEEALGATWRTYTSIPEGVLSDFVAPSGTMTERLEVFQTGPSAASIPCSEFDFADIKVSQ